MTPVNERDNREAGGDRPPGVSARGCGNLVNQLALATAVLCTWDRARDRASSRQLALRVACETLVNTGMAVISGEITSDARVDYTQIARDTICDIGYDDPKLGFDGNAIAVLLAIDKQSQDIALGVDEGTGTDLEQGAGDQGLMYGFATDETDDFPAYLPSSL